MPIQLFCTGDSITAASSYVSVANGDNLANVRQLAPGIAHSITNSQNYAIPGYATSDLVAQAATLRAAMALTGSYCILTVMSGHNDFAQAVDPITALPPYLDSMRSSRIAVGLCTLLPSDPAVLPTFNTSRAPVNVAYRTWVGVHCDFLIDFDLTTMGADTAPVDRSLYYDGIHPQVGGREILGPFYAAKVNTFFETIPKSTFSVFGRPWPGA